MSAIELVNVSASPWGVPVLTDISLTVAPGEVLGIVGPNGAGKTSLLKLLAADFPVDGGVIRVTGIDNRTMSAQERARKLAYLPQFSLLNFPYTVDEVVLLGRTPHDSGREEDLRIVDLAIERADVQDLRGRLYTQLSGGEKQRVQLARVLAQIWDENSMADRVLLLDEPTTALDLAHQQQLVELIRALKAKSCAVLVVVHDFNLLSSIADHIVVLDRGRQVDQGSPESIYRPEMFAQLFHTRVVIQRHPSRGYPIVVPS